MAVTFSKSLATRRAAALSALLAIGFVGLYLFDLSSAPFFPDESSYIFMSRDFVTAFLKGDPSALMWQPGESLTREMRYRLRDGAVPRDLIGLSLWLHGYSAADVNADWAWDQPWQANVLNRQIPQPGVLRASRVPSAVLAALTAVLIFWIGASMRGPGVGLTAALAFGLTR